MQKVQYGDVNRFLVSIGLILISLSLVLPYLYLKEDFGLYIDKEDIQYFTQITKETIRSKSLIVKSIQNNLITISSILLIVGVIFLIAGLRRWFKRQKKIDEKQDLDIEKLKREIDNLTQEEIREKAAKELDQNQYSEYKEEQKQLGTDQKDNKESIVNNYLAVEEKVIAKFKEYKSNNFDVLDNIRVAGRYTLDILLQSKNSRFSDRIVEVKYAHKIIANSTIDSALNQLNQSSKFYTKFYNRNVVPVLLFIYADSAHITDTQLKSLRERIQSHVDTHLSRAMKRLNVQFIKESDIEKFDLRKILKK